MKAQRHTIAALVKQFTENQTDEITYNLAGWFNQDSTSPSSFPLVTFQESEKGR